MSKIGRNETCPCGSGKKYKKCCSLTKQALPKFPSGKAFDSLFIAKDDYLDEASNRIIDLIKQNKIELAEKEARNLIVDYPEAHDGFERMAMVYEAKGEKLLAAQMYQQALDFTIAHTENEYEEGFRDWYREKIKKLTLEEADEVTVKVEEILRTDTTIPSDIRPTLDKIVTAAKELADEYRNRD